MIDFTEIGLFIAVSEAGAVDGLSTLFDTADTEAFDAPVYSDAAIYALQRMGMPAFEAAMRYIERASDEATVRMTAYEVLHAAVDDPSARSIVADFCLAQLPMEELLQNNDEANALVSCCEVLVILKDARVRPFLEKQAAAGSLDLPELLEDLNSDKEADFVTDWAQKALDRALPRMV